MNEKIRYTPGQQVRIKKESDPSYPFEGVLMFGGYYGVASCVVTNDEGRGLVEYLHNIEPVKD